MRRIMVGLCVVFVLLIVAGCGRHASTLSVDELLNSGSKYDGQTVTVQGTVTLTISGILNMIKLEDLLTVSINGAAPQDLGIKDGDTVVATGKYTSENRTVECSSSDVKKVR